MAVHVRVSVSACARTFVRVYVHAGTCVFTAQCLRRCSPHTHARAHTRTHTHTHTYACACVRVYNNNNNNNKTSIVLRASETQAQWRNKPESLSMTARRGKRKMYHQSEGQLRFRVELQFLKHMFFDFLRKIAICVLLGACVRVCTLV